MLHVTEAVPAATIVLWTDRHPPGWLHVIPILYRMNFLELQGVTKTYATKAAVQDVTFQVPEGSIFGLLGPNGAGKTSLIRMITHITMPDKGRILFQGQPLRESHQQLIGYMPEERGLYKKMPVHEQITYLLELKGMSHADARSATQLWLKKFELTEWGPRKVDELSKGMQQKVQFIATIAHKPPLLILDEPFSGLDPLNQQLLEDTLQELVREGTTVIFSTHRMEQVEAFCTHIALINNSQLVLNDETTTLRRRYRQNRYRIDTETPIPADLALPAGTTLISRSATHLDVQLADGASARPFIGWANDKLELTRFELHLPSIRDIFIQAVTASGGTVPVEAVSPATA